MQSKRKKKSEAADPAAITHELSTFRGLMLNLNQLLERLEEMADRETVHEVMRNHPDRMDRRILRRIARDLARFLETPKVDHRRHHPDSERERMRFVHYRERGLTIRDISEKAGMSLYTVNQKLKRYNVK